MAEVKKTSIQLSVETKKKLASFGTKEDTYEKIILRILKNDAESSKLKS